MRAWKQVNRDDAHFLETGRLKIGRLEDYSTLENGRADNADGAVVIMADSLHSYIPEHMRAMERLGMEVASGPIGSAMIGCQFTHISQPLYAFCMSQCGCDYDPSPGTAKATFEVSAVNALGWQLAKNLSDRVLSWKVRRVTYKRRYYDALDENYGDPDPFIKDHKFILENEIRIIFLPKPGSPFETIYTNADAAISRLLIRIG